MNLQAHREAQLLTQRQLAKKAGVSLRTIQYIEDGDHPPRMVTRRKLLEALGLPLSDHTEVFGALRREVRSKTRAKPPADGLCLHCGAELPRTHTAGRPKSYCNDECRGAFHAER